MPKTPVRTLAVAVVALVGILGAAGPATSREEPQQPDAAVLAAREADRSYLAITPETLAMTVEQLATVYNTPAKVWYLLEHAVTYAFDKDVYGVDEYFATAEELWARKRGDCEDWAAFARALLDRNGYTTVLFSAWRPERDAGGNDGHTVVAVLENGGWNHISNLGYIRAEALTQEELAASVFPNWTRSNTWYFTGATQTRDGLNGWHVTAMVANRAGVRTLVRTDAPRGATASASGN